MLTAIVVILFPRFNIAKCDLMTGFNVDINLRLGQDGVASSYTEGCDQY